MQFSGGHGCAGHCVRWKHHGLRLWRKRGFRELQCKLETQCFPVFCIFLFLLCCSLLGNMKALCSVINVTNRCISPQCQSCPVAAQNGFSFFLISQSLPRKCCVMILCLSIEVQEFHPNLLIQALTCSWTSALYFSFSKQGQACCSASAKNLSKFSICTVNFNIFSPKILSDTENLRAEGTGGALTSSPLLLLLIFKLPQWTLSLVEKACNIWSWFKYYINPLMNDRKTIPFPLFSSNPQKDSHSSLELLYIDCWIQNDLHILISCSSCLPNQWHWDQSGLGESGSDLWKFVPQRFNQQWLPVNF